MTTHTTAPGRTSRPVKALSFALSLLAALTSTAWADGAPLIVSPIGSFGVIQLSGEHCEGQSIELWKSAETILGVVHACAGLIDTKRTSIIVNQHYDQDTGAIDFTTSLSVGMDYLGNGREVPSKDVWVFRGRLRGKVLTGVLTMTDKNYPTATPLAKILSLQQQRKSLPSFANAGTWMQWASGITSNRP